MWVYARTLRTCASAPAAESKEFTAHESYFKYYMTTHPEQAGELNTYFFRHWVRPEDTVLDFGCGGGFLLNNLAGRRKLCIEINPLSRREAAAKNGVEAHSSLSEIADASVDVAVSTHCLEHVQNPVAMLLELRNKLRPGGRVVFLVPGHSNMKPGLARYKKTDPDHHIYEWSPQTLGNLLDSAGFEVEQAERLAYTWYEGNFEKYKREGVAAWLGKAQKLNRNPQLRVVAIKPPLR